MIKSLKRYDNFHIIIFIIIINSYFLLIFYSGWKCLRICKINYNNTNWKTIIFWFKIYIKIFLITVRNVLWNKLIKLAEKRDTKIKKKIVTKTVKREYLFISLYWRRTILLWVVLQLCLIFFYLFLPTHPCLYACLYMLVWFFSDFFFSVLC